MGKQIKDHKGKKNKTVLRGDQDAKLETRRNGTLAAAAKTHATNVCLGNLKDMKEVLQFLCG